MILDKAEALTRYGLLKLTGLIPHRDLSGYAFAAAVIVSDYVFSPFYRLEGM